MFVGALSHPEAPVETVLMVIVAVFGEVELRKPKQTWQRFLPLCSLQPAVTFARASKATLQT